MFKLSTFLHNVIMTYTITPWEWAAFVAVLGTLLGLLLNKLEKEQPVITVDQDASFRMGLARFMIVTDNQTFYFDSHTAMMNFTDGCLMPYEMWEQDSKLKWYYLGGNKHA